MTARRVRHIRSSSSWRPASADHREPIVPHGGAEERLAFPRGEGEAPAMWILQQDTNVRGLDHGVGHPLLLLYDVKAPSGQKSNEFKGLGYYSSDASLSNF